MPPPVPFDSATRALLARLRSFCLPGGEDAASPVRAVKISERGEMRAAPDARWMPFTAEEVIDAARSSFRWDARFGGAGRISPLVVTDAYEEGHGRLVLKLGGLVPVKKSVGLEFDKGELQRYLATIVLCPPILIHHASLDWAAAGPLVLRVRDREDPTGAAIDLHFNDEGCPTSCRADRPRLIGKQSVVTPWSGVYSDFQEREGLRIPNRLEVAWHPPGGPFTYFRSELTSFTALR